MRFRLLACDYDRTIAQDAVVTEPVVEALRWVTASGRKLVLVTGRTMDELRTVFDDLPLFSRIIVENGAVLHRPDAANDLLLCPPVAPGLVAELRRRGVEPLVVGKGILSTAATNDAAVAAALADLSLDWHLVYNRDSVMVMAPGISKASGVRAAAADLGVPMDQGVAVGDGENDIALLEATAVGVAVENAIEPLKDVADIVLTRPGADGIRELCESLVQRDLADLLAASAARA